MAPSEPNNPPPSGKLPEGGAASDWLLPEWLTPAEIEALRQDAKEASDYLRKTFAQRRPLAEKPGPRGEEATASGIESISSPGDEK